MSSPGQGTTEVGAGAGKSCPDPKGCQEAGHSTAKLRNLSFHRGAYAKDTANFPHLLLGTLGTKQYPTALPVGP